MICLHSCCYEARLKRYNSSSYVLAWAQEAVQALVFEPNVMHFNLDML